MTQGNRRTSAVVPTLGRSPLLSECLQRLRADGGPELEIILVHQGENPVDFEVGTVDRVERVGENRGFTAGVNVGLAGIDREFVALLNDDVLIEPGWLTALIDALEYDEDAAAAQGVNLQLDDPRLIDGCGVAWNLFWRPVQIGHGMNLPHHVAPRNEVFGVSATAAVYRRQALEKAARHRSEILDSRLVSFYEDVELSSRLRSLGFHALLVPQAQTRHAGSLTARRMPRERLRLHFSNRYLVLAAVLGRSFWPRVPLLLLRDSVDLANDLFHGRYQSVSAELSGWRRALRLLPEFAHRQASSPSLRELARFRVLRAATWPFR